ncbi:hypothetical protein [Pseudomonas sp. B21-031]|nr:hypothetical protein [Pseudomonas sp. B21-031]UVL67910.1 hypothetical protein LOY53_05310 [Pseudomonas sp. B21-031]
MLLGYYSLANTSVALDDLSEEQARKMPRYPMPAAMLSRLAVDQRMQRKGLGQRLMADFFPSYLHGFKALRGGLHRCRRKR